MMPTEIKVDQTVAYRLVNKYYCKLAAEMPDVLAALKEFIPPSSMQDIYWNNRVILMHERKSDASEKPQ
jgi:hypothetical protein